MKKLPVLIYHRCRSHSEFILPSWFVHMSVTVDMSEFMFILPSPIYLHVIIAFIWESWCEDKTCEPTKYTSTIAGGFSSSESSSELDIFNLSGANQQRFAQDCMIWSMTCGCSFLRRQDRSRCGHVSRTQCILNLYSKLLVFYFSWCGWMGCAWTTQMCLHAKSTWMFLSARRTILIKNQTLSTSLIPGNICCWLPTTMSVVAWAKGCKLKFQVVSKGFAAELRFIARHHCETCNLLRQSVFTNNVTRRSTGRDLRGALSRGIADYVLHTLYKPKLVQGLVWRAWNNSPM